MPLALKAQWTVTAGLIPGRLMPEYTRAFQYTSADVEHDRNNGGVNADDSHFRTTAREVNEYVMHLQSGGMNFVDLNYVWF